MDVVLLVVNGYGREEEWESKPRKFNALLTCLLSGFAYTGRACAAAVSRVLRSNRSRRHYEGIQGQRHDPRPTWRKTSSIEAV